MKDICLVYRVENDMNTISKEEADACVEESLADEDAAGRPATSSSPTRDSQSREQGASAMRRMR
jgi:hypothetical protein